MIILRNKSFSDKETKLKFGDRMDIWGNKHLNTKSGREYKRKYLKGEKDTPLTTEEALTIGAISGGPLLITGTAPMLEAAAGKYKKAALLSAGGALTEQMVNKAVGKYNKRSLKKNPHANDKALDKIDVAEGKMTKEDFARKWYNYKEKNNDNSKN